LANPGQHEIRSKAGTAGTGTTAKKSCGFLIKVNFSLILMRNLQLFFAVCAPPVTRGAGLHYGLFTLVCKYLYNNSQYWEKYYIQ
jgi:hypothetical protein